MKSDQINQAIGWPDWVASEEAAHRRGRRNQRRGGNGTCQWIEKRAELAGQQIEIQRVHVAVVIEVTDAECRAAQLVEMSGQRVEIERVDVPIVIRVCGQDEEAEGEAAGLRVSRDIAGAATG